MHMLPYGYYFHGLCYENSFDVFGHDENYLYYVISNSFLFEFFFFSLLFLFSYNAQLENLYGSAQIIME
jgi:hypothetical protein